MLCSSLACLFMLATGCAETSANDASDLDELEGQAQSLVVPYVGCVDRAQADTAIDKQFYESAIDVNAGSSNGTILRCERLLYDTSRPGYDVYRVIYRTSTRVTQGGVASDVALPASGTIFVPQAKATAQRPIVAHTHGLTGLITKCAPSFGQKLDSIQTLQQVADVVKDPVVVAPDYVGLGVDHKFRVPDVDNSITDFFAIYQRIKPFQNLTHTFVSSTGEGRATVDLVRAARTMPNASTGSNPNWVVVGQSQGGHAALATAEVVQAQYDVEMRLRAVIAGAPATNFEDRNWDPGLKNGFESMIIAAATLENRDLRASDFITSKAQSAFYYSMGNQCIDLNGFLSLWATFGLAGSSPWKVDPFTNAEALKVIRSNSPGRVRVAFPIFVGQVLGDPLIKPERTRGFIAQARNAGNDVTYCEYASVDNVNAFNNHNLALARVSDNGATCMDASGVPQTMLNASNPPASVPVTMHDWLRKVYKTN